jgi:hypothetical protein
MDMLQKITKNRRYWIKKKYFDSVSANQVSIKSPVPGLSDAEWRGLKEMWTSEKHQVCL